MLSLLHSMPPSFFNCSAQPASAFAPVTLTNGDVTATMIAYGATMTHLLVKDSDGEKRDVLLGWDDATQYCANAEHTYFGATIGRVANRIAGCAFDLGGKTYKISCNEKDFDTLHGGVVGFDRRVWAAIAQTASSVTWQYTSPDGEMGFPGAVEINVTHSIRADNTWSIEYSATSDAETVLMMTNHAYFNLNANVDNTATVLKHVLALPTTTKALEVTGAPDYHLLPTGKVLTIAPGSFLDFKTKAKEIGHDINSGVVTAQGGYDNAFIFESSETETVEKMPIVAQLSSPLTKIALTMRTDQPSVQIYTGNFLNGTDTTLRLQRKASQSFGSTPQYYHWRGAITLEAQGYPDAVHHSNFPSQVLKPGERYTQSTSYTFSVLK